MLEIGLNQEHLPSMHETLGSTLVVYLHQRKEESFYISCVPKSMALGSYPLCV